MESCTREFLIDPNALCFRSGTAPFAARVFDIPTIFISDPERALLALIRYNKELSGRAGNREVAAALFGNSVLYQDGQEHRRLRAMLRPLFVHAATPEALQSVTGITGEFIQQAAHVNGISSLEFFRSLMVGVIAAHYLDIHIELSVARDLSIAINHLGKGLYASSFSPARRSRFQYANRARAKINKFLRSNLKVNTKHGLLSLSLDTEDRLDQAVTLLFAGVDTVSATLTWALNDLLNEVGTQRLNILGAKASDAFTRALIQYPPVYFIPRGALVEVDLAGTVVPHGWNVNIMINALHRNFWNSGNRRSYMPFGRGPKQCPGQAFTMVAGPLILNTLLHSSHLSSVGGDPTKIGYLPGQHPSSSARLYIRPRKYATILP